MLCWWWARATWDWRELGFTWRPRWGGDSTRWQMGREKNVDMDILRVKRSRDRRAKVIGEEEGSAGGGEVSARRWAIQ